MAGSGVAALVTLSEGLSALVMVAPLSPLPVLASVTFPSTRPPGTGWHDLLCTTTLSSCHQPPHIWVEIKWNRNSTELLPAACGTGIVSRSGPNTLSLVCSQMF